MSRDSGKIKRAIYQKLKGRTLYPEHLILKELEKDFGFVPAEIKIELDKAARDEPQWLESLRESYRLRSSADIQFGDWKMKTWVFLTKHWPAVLSNTIAFLALVVSVIALVASLD